MERAWLYTSADETLSAAADRAVADLVEIWDLASGIGADCIVVLIPDETQVDAGLQREVARAWGRSRESLDFARPTRVVAAALARADVSRVDLLPAFQQAGATRRLYKPSDTHWNIAGNRVAAETIAPAVTGVAGAAVGGTAAPLDLPFAWSRRPSHCRNCGRLCRERTGDRDRRTALRCDVFAISCRRTSSNGRARLPASAMAPWRGE